MPSATSPSSSRAGAGAGAGRRWCTRCDLLILALAAMLCSATYCFSIWHNGRNAPEKIVLGKTPVVASAKVCGDASADAADLDFEAHHAAESAGLSVSARAPTISGRRALRAAALEPGHRGPIPWTVPNRGGRKGWVRVDDDRTRLTHTGAVRR